MTKPDLRAAVLAAAPQMTVAEVVRRFGVARITARTWAKAAGVRFRTWTLEDIRKAGAKGGAAPRNWGGSVPRRREQAPLAPPRSTRAEKRRCVISHTSQESILRDAGLDPDVVRAGMVLFCPRRRETRERA